MTVVFKQGEQMFKASEVLWIKKELVDAVVKEALVSQTEAFIDMIMDGEKPEDITRANVNETLRGVKESAGEFLKDVLADLEIAIKARLEEALYGAVVTGIKYNIVGEVTDIEVDVSVS